MTGLQPGTTMYRIAELERAARELRGDVRELRGLLRLAERRIRSLEGQTPLARQLQLEADQAAADLAASGYVEGLSTECAGRWHDRCPPGVHCDCECHVDDEPEESPLAARDAYIGTWSNQDVTRRVPNAEYLSGGPS